MDISWMRDKLMNNCKYSSSIKWKNKVSAMSDDQVCAVYFKFKYEGLLFNKKSSSKDKNSKLEFKQMTIFDYEPDLVTVKEK